MSTSNFKMTVVLTTLALLVSVSVFARSKDEHSVRFADPVLVGSTPLKAGTYNVEWQGPASSLKVNFLRYGKIVATAPAKMVEKKMKFPSDEVITAKVQDKQRLEEIDFGGKTQGLVFVSSQTAAK